MSDVSVAVVTGSERVTDDNGHSVDITADQAGEQLLTLADYPPLGDDALPLPGDFVAVGDMTGNGVARASGYVDTKNPGVALPGEKRIYARDPDDGSVVAEIWLKGAGDIAIKSIKAGGKINLNGVEIDQDGNITAPGEVTAKAGTPALVTLTQHTHPTGTGPSGPAIPGA